MTKLKSQKRISDRNIIAGGKIKQIGTRKKTPIQVPKEIKERANRRKRAQSNIRNETRYQRKTSNKDESQILHTFMGSNNISLEEMKRRQGIRQATIDKIKRKRKPTGEEVGKSLLLGLVSKHEANISLYTDEDLEKITLKIRSDKDIKDYNAYINIQNTVIDLFKYYVRHTIVGVPSIADLSRFYALNRYLEVIYLQRGGELGKSQSINLNKEEGLPDLPLLIHPYVVFKRPADDKEEEEKTYLSFNYHQTLQNDPQTMELDLRQNTYKRIAYNGFIKGIAKYTGVKDLLYFIHEVEQDHIDVLKDVIEDMETRVKPAFLTEGSEQIKELKRKEVNRSIETLHTILEVLTNDDLEDSYADIVINTLENDPYYFNATTRSDILDRMLYRGKL